MFRDHTTAPTLRAALNWHTEDDTLSGTEAALTRIMHALDADLDALDAAEQRALAQQIAATATDTETAEQAGQHIIDGRR